MILKYQQTLSPDSARRQITQSVQHQKNHVLSSPILKNSYIDRIAALGLRKQEDGDQKEVTGAVSGGTQFYPMSMSHRDGFEGSSTTLSKVQKNNFFQSNIKQSIKKDIILRNPLSPANRISKYRATTAATHF